jgi:hypothetical protein
MWATYGEAWALRARNILPAYGLPVLQGKQQRNKTE